MTVPEGTDERPACSLEQAVAVIRNLCDVADVPERGRILLQRALVEMTALELSSVLQGAGVTHRGLALGLLADLLAVHVVHARPEAVRARRRCLAPGDDYGRRCVESEEWGRKRAAALWLAWAAREGSGRAENGARLATSYGPHALEERRAWGRALRAACESTDRAALDRMLAHEEEAILLAAAHRRPWGEVLARLAGPAPPAAAPAAPGPERGVEELRAMTAAELAELLSGGAVAGLGCLDARELGGVLGVTDGAVRKRVSAGALPEASDRQGKGRLWAIDDRLVEAVRAESPAALGRLRDLLLARGLTPTAEPSISSSIAPPDRPLEAGGGRRIMPRDSRDSRD